MVARAISVIGLAVSLAAIATCVSRAENLQWTSNETRAGVTVWFSESSEVRRASTFLRDGQYFEAINLAELALTHDLRSEDRRRALNVLCIGYVKAEAALLALPHCDQLVKLDVRGWKAHNSRGNAHFALGRYDKALADFETALKLAERYNPPPREDADTQDDRPSSGGPEAGRILAEHAISDPAALVRQNLALTRKVLESAENL